MKYSKYHFIFSEAKNFPIGTQFFGKKKWEEDATDISKLNIWELW